jgi:hypothetical protein
MTALTRALVACYPAAWRRRYGDEYAQLLRDLRIHRRPALIVDSLFGAVRAHGGVHMSRRSPMAVLVWAAGLFTVAGSGFAKLAEDFPGYGRVAYAVLAVAAAVALLSLLAAAAPAARDRRAWKYAAVPVAGAALWYGVLRVALAAGHRTAGFIAISAAGLLVVAATAAAAATVLRRVPAPSPARRSPVAAGMAVATIAAVVWGLQVRAGDPSGFRGANGLLATPFAPDWIAVVLALASATALAAYATRPRTGTAPS